jgi:hypothetical protein
VVVIRVSSLVGAAVRYTVALDGTDFFRVGTGQHAEFSVAPGEHRIAVKCFGGWSLDRVPIDCVVGAHGTSRLRQRPDNFAVAQTAGSRSLARGC